MTLLLCICRSPGARGRHWLCLSLAVLFALASVFPPLHVLLPRDPLAVVVGGIPADRAPAGPTLWFPLAYALTGLPPTPARPAQVQAQARAGMTPVLARTAPALPAGAALTLGRPDRASDAPGLAALRPAAAAPALPDPPPRPAPRPARAA